MKRQIIYSLVLYTILLSSCTSEPFPENTAQDEHICRLTFNVTKNGFSESRTSDSEWKNGDCVYLSFINGEDKVDGRAVYNASTEYWTLYYNGQLPTGISSTCYAYFFDNDYNDTGENVKLSILSCVYADKNATYTKNIDGVSVTASLMTQTGRIKFKGESGISFNVSNISYYTSFNKNEAALTSRDETVSVTIGEDGTTQYLYFSLPTSSRTLTIAYDNLTFNTDCEHPVLDAGLSGYMTIPTRDNHNGWRMIEKTTPSIGVVTVSDIDMHSAKLMASILSDGNSPVNECGFCYSKSSSASVDDIKIDCEINDNKFNCSLASLTAKTTYYVRAYAINEMGISYSEEISFTTKGSKPGDDDNKTPQI